MLFELLPEDELTCFGEGNELLISLFHMWKKKRHETPESTQSKASPVSNKEVAQVTSPPL